MRLDLTQYASPGTTTSIRSWGNKRKVRPQDEERIFETFYGARTVNRARVGFIANLPICRGFVEAVSGLIDARDRPDRSGAFFTIRLPGPVIGRSLDIAA